MSNVRQIKAVDPADRNLPGNIEYERWVLGSAIIHEGSWEKLSGALNVEDFLIEKHRRIFSALGDLAARGDPFDYVGVAESLKRRGQLESVDGLSYLAELTRDLPQLVCLEKYLQIIKNHSIARQGAAASQSIVNQVLVGAGEPADILARGIGRLQAIQSQAGGVLASIDSLTAVGAPDEEEAVFIVAPELPAAAVVAFTGESGSGKSTLMTAYAREAIAKGHAVLVLDRENPRRIVRERFQRLGLVESEMLRWWGGWNTTEAPEPGADVVRKWVKAQEKEPLVIVDNLSAFHGGDENEAGEMRAFMNQARQLASLGACVVVLHNSGKGETSKDYRGSSDFKAAVDQAFHVSNIGDNGRLDRLSLRCYKSRFGTAGSITYFYADGRFERDHRPHAEEISVSVKLTALLRQNPAVSSTKFETLAASQNISRMSAREFLSDGVLSGSVSREKGHRNHFLHCLV